MTRSGTLLDPVETPEAVGITQRVLRTADALYDLGVRPPDRVLVQGDNSTSYVVTLLALMHLGTSLVPVDHRQTIAADLEQSARQSGAGWLLTGGLATEVAGVKTIDYRILPTSDEDPPTGRAEQATATTPLPLTKWFARDDAVILWSSGTTGQPKGIVRSGRSLYGNTVRTVEAMGYGPDDVLAPLLPFSHQYGLSVVLLWWLAGCRLLVTPYQHVGTAIEQAAAYGATAVDAAPVTYRALLGVLRRRPALRAPLERVRIWGVGGAPLPAPLAREFVEVLERPLLDGYGMTELGNISLATPDTPEHCGRPLPGVKVRVVRDGFETAPGESGRIEVRSPDLMEGYLLADGTLDPVPDEGWYETGDLGRLDEQGRLTVLGRDRAVDRMGFTLYPERLERKAEACGRDVKVLAVADKRRGHVLHFVVEDPDGGSAEEWRTRMAAHLAEYERPNAVHVVPRFPTQGPGKVDTEALRELLPAGAEQATGVEPQPQDRSGQDTDTDTDTGRDLARSAAPTG